MVQEVGCQAICARLFRCCNIKSRRKVICTAFKMTGVDALFRELVVNVRFGCHARYCRWNKNMFLIFAIKVLLVEESLQTNGIFSKCTLSLKEN